MVSEKTLDSNPHTAVGILTGSTASGKSQMAFDFACAHGKIEIINADSLQVYRGMDIGTAKPTPEELCAIPHHLIDIRDPNEAFTAGEFVRSVHIALNEIHARGHRALIVGGTGFYLKALLFGLWDVPASSLEFKQTLENKTNDSLWLSLQTQDRDSAKRISPSDRYRLTRALELIHLTGKSPRELQEKHRPQVDPCFRLWVIQRSPAEIALRIHQRTQQMLNQGLIAEFKTLHTLFPECRNLKSVGYAQVGDYLAARIPSGRKMKAGLPGLTDEIDLATRQLVKKQRTWFRNQLKQLPDTLSACFELEKERSQLELALKTVYF